MPGFDLGGKDLPGFDMEDLDQSPSLQLLVRDSLAMKRTSGLILNTIDDLEASCFPHILPQFRKVYTVAPLHALLNSRLGDRSRVIASNGSLWNADQNCMAWLDSQPLRSVVYVSFGSLVKISHSQLLEFLHGLVQSGYPFLWVIRPDVLFDDTDSVIQKEFQVGPKENGYVVDWAPQEQVLAHHAVGGFLTHTGWNSILESIMARVPVICWPNWGDQCINSECVVKLWRIGVQLDAIDRSSIRSTINTLMGNRRDEFQRSVDTIAKLAEYSITDGGSSYKNVETLVNDIKKIKM